MCEGEGDRLLRPVFSIRPAPALPVFAVRRTGIAKQPAPADGWGHMCGCARWSEANPHGASSPWPELYHIGMVYR